MTLYVKWIKFWILLNGATSPSLKRDIFFFAETILVQMTTTKVLHRAKEYFTKFLPLLHREETKKKRAINVKVRGTWSK